jgi:hypothetical protein
MCQGSRDVCKFYRYVDKVFDFSKETGMLKDSRQKPQIPTSSVWLSAFWMFATRRGSLNAVETLLRIPKRVDSLTGPRKPSADTIGRVFGMIDTEELRAMLCRIDHRLGRNKVLYNHWPVRIVAFDGHEFFFQPTQTLQRVSTA